MTCRSGRSVGFIFVAFPCHKDARSPARQAGGSEGEPEGTAPQQPPQLGTPPPPPPPLRMRGRTRQRHLPALFATARSSPWRMLTRRKRSSEERGESPLHPPALYRRRSGVSVPLRRRRRRLSPPPRLLPGRRNPGGAAGGGGRWRLGLAGRRRRQRQQQQRLCKRGRRQPAPELVWTAAEQGGGWGAPPPPSPAPDPPPLPPSPPLSPSPPAPVPRPRPGPAWTLALRRVAVRGAARPRTAAAAERGRSAAPGRGEEGRGERCRTPR